MSIVTGKIYKGPFFQSVVFCCLKNVRIFCKRFSHFPNKTYTVFVIFTFEIFSARTAESFLPGQTIRV